MDCRRADSSEDVGVSDPETPPPPRSPADSAGAPEPRPQLRPRPSEELLLDDCTSDDDEDDDVVNTAWEGAPAAHDALDLVVLDVDDDDLGDDEERAPRPQSRQPSCPPCPVPCPVLAIMPASCEEEPVAVAMAAEAEAGGSEAEGEGEEPGAQRAQRAQEYFKGLGKRLEPFAQLAVPVDPQDQSLIRARLTAIQRFREDNAAALAEDSAQFPLGGRESGPPFCRICRDTGECEYNKEPVVSPCQCRGSVARVHMSCLERWLAESDSSCCELCGHQYRTVRTPSYNILTSIPAWMINTGSTDLIFDLVAFLIFTPVALFGTHLGVNAEDNPYFQVTLMAAIDLVYSAWLFMRLHYHTVCWYSWWRRKSTVKVILDPNAAKNDMSDS